MADGRSQIAGTSLRLRSGSIWIRRPDRNLRNETAVVHLQHGHHRVRDLERPQFALADRALLSSRGREELGLYLARVDLHDPDVVLAKLGAPALRHPTQRELARRIGRAAHETALSRGRGDV